MPAAGPPYGRAVGVLVVVSAWWHVPLCDVQRFTVQERFIPHASVRPEPLPRQVGCTNAGPELSYWEGAG